jgi:hypothetical protein
MQSTRACALPRHQADRHCRCNAEPPVTSVRDTRKGEWCRRIRRRGCFFCFVLYVKKEQSRGTQGGVEAEGRVRSVRDATVRRSG